MKMLSVWLMVVAFVYAPGARADEKKLAAKDVPAAVREAVKKRNPKAKASHWAVETEAGKTVYEVKLTEGGETIELIVAPDGTALTEEKDLKVTALPEAVKAALAASKYAKAKLSGAEQVTELAKPDAPTYEVKLVHEGKKREVVFDLKGAIVKDEAE